MRGWIIAGAYVVGAFATFGYTFNETYVEPVKIECGVRPDIMKDYAGNRAWYDCEMNRIDVKYNPRSNAAFVGFISTYKAIAWPIYWAGRGAIEVFR